MIETCPKCDGRGVIDYDICTAQECDNEYNCPICGWLQSSHTCLNCDGQGVVETEAEE